MQLRNLYSGADFLRVSEGTLKHHQEMARNINYNYHGGNSSSDAAVDESYLEIPHGEFESTYTTISIYAPAVYRNTSTMEQLKGRLKNQYPSTNFTVEDNDDAEDVILVHYYPDEGDDEIDEDDVVEFVKDRFDGDAYLYYN